MEELPVTVTCDRLLRVQITWANGEVAQRETKEMHPLLFFKVGALTIRQDS